MPQNLEPVDPVKPLAPYIGGKKSLARHLVQRIGAIDHDIYAEAFVGMGGIFFRRDRRPKSEAINDWSLDVANFFRVVQVHLIAFLDYMRHYVTSRAEFERMLREDPATLTDIQRAARFLYLQKTSFGGKVAGRGFGIAPGNPARFDIMKLQPMIEAVHERLSCVTIERLPWSDFLRRWDRPSTLFYLDPPYYGCEGDYGQNMFKREEFEAMAAQLATLKGNFLLSINDHPEVRRIFAAFPMEEVQARYTIGGMDKSRHFGELIIGG